MAQDNFPQSLSDPESDGIPGYADDDSFADEAGSSREADGPDPAAMPGRDPIAVDDFGTTAEEQRAGEPLDLRLSREVPDVSDAEPPPPVDDIAPGADAPTDPELDATFEGGDARLDSEVSILDRMDDAPAGTVGRVVEPDEGIGADTEADAIGSDRGSAGGGASAEESALHIEADRG